MIKINHLTITQNKDLRDLVSDLTMTIQDGEKVAIIGEEGNGKSTLLRALMGEALPDFTIRGDIQSDYQSIAYIPQTADTIVHLRLVKHRKEAETLVEHLDYDSYSDQRKANFSKQSQQAANDQRAYDKTMEKHRRVKQNVETVLRATKDSTAGRLLAKKMKTVLSQEKRYERAVQSMTQKPLEEEQIQLFFSDIQPLPASKTLIQLEKENLSIGERVLAQKLQLTVRGQEKIGIIGANGVGKSTLLAKLQQLLSAKREVSLGFMPQDYHKKLQLSLSPIDYLSQTGEKEEIQKIQSHLASLNFSYQEMQHQIHSLSGGQQGKLLLLDLVLRKPNFLLLDEPTRNFSPTSQPEIRKLFASYPGGFITVSHDRRFLQEVCTTIYRLTELGLEVVNLEDL